MEEYQQEMILSFCEVCGCDFDIATQYLQCSDWSTETAIAMYFENGGAPMQVHGVSSEIVKEETGSQLIPSLCEHCRESVKELSASCLVYREECVYCFHSWDEGNGIDICLSCYLGFCSGCNKHSQFHWEKTGHSLFLRIARIEVSSDSDQSPSKLKKLTKLAIGVEGGLEEVLKQYETTMRVICVRCSEMFAAEGYYHELGERILLRVSGEKEKDLFKWEAENLKPCPHCDAYRLPNPCPEMSKVGTKCVNCEVNENLWLCLQCGEFHCGRKQWDVGGLPGNGHALEHFKTTGHSLAVKVASLQENRADVHCYECDDNAAYNYGDVLFPSVLEVLTQLGVVVDGRVVGLSVSKQEKSLQELNLLVNTEFDFSMSDDGGKAYPLCGDESSCGLDNLGNSCYLNAILQRMEELGWWEHSRQCKATNPADCLLCQLVKVRRAMYEGGMGRSVRPRMLKQALGRVAKEFDNNRQQDCYELLTVLLDKLTVFAPHGLCDVLRLSVHYVMKCLECGSQHPSPADEDNCLTIQLPSEGEVPTTGWSLQRLLQASMEGECLERECECCGHNTICSRIQVLDQFPAVLCVRVNRFMMDMNTLAIVKNTAPVELDERLTLRQCDDEEIQPNESQTYKLRAACLHRGDKADFGHYVAVYKEDNQDEWVLCNDAKVVVASDPPTSECYLVFYEKYEQ